MSELIDRGSAAMRAKRRELIAQPLDRIWPDLMRAAVAAMREPTVEMRVADAVKEWPDDAAACWRAMIDAALEAPSHTSHKDGT